MSKILVNVTRGGLVESMHRGDLVVVDSAGEIIYSAGDPHRTTYWRSAAKPFQALPLVEEGGMERFGLTARELALITSSHGGEEEHTRAVAEILNKLNLSCDSLGCGPAAPMYGRAARELLKSGRPCQPVHNACSGKHSGMLATCLLQGWPVSGYHQPQHPLQQAMLEAVSGVTGTPAEEIHIGIDGCGVPVFGLPIYNMAVAYSRLARPEGQPEEKRRDALRRIRDAMTANPFYVAGTGRLDTALMEAAGGRLVAKLGSEAVYCVGLVGEGMALALKIDDGNYRALDPVVVKVLSELGWLREEEAQKLRPRLRPEIKNHRGEVVGYLESPIKVEVLKQAGRL